MAAALESLNGFSFVRVCWCFSFSLWVREHADTRWLIGNTTKESEGEIEWWWLNHEWQHYTLSSEFESKREEGNITLLRSMSVCASIQMIERERETDVDCIVLLVVFAAVAHRSHHHQTNVVLPTQQQQTHCQTPTSSTSNIHLLATTTITTKTKYREREREQYLCLGCWVVGLSWCCLSTNQRTTSIKLVTWLIDWISQSSSNINHV